MGLFRRKKKAENDRGSLPTSEVKQSAWNMIEINRKINDIVDEYDGKYDQLSELYEKRQELNDEFAAVSDAYDSRCDDIDDEWTPSTHNSNFNKQMKSFEIYDKKYLKFEDSIDAIDMKILVELELILNKKFCRKCCILHSDICEKMKKKDTSAFCQCCGAELKLGTKFCGKCGTTRA